MSRRTLRFVETESDAGAPDPSTDVVVLDTSWTPERDGRRDLIPLRPIVQDVVASVDLFDASLARLDAWADATGLPDRLMVDGVSWWFHARAPVRRNLHELMLWDEVLQRVAPVGHFGAIQVPRRRQALHDALMLQPARARAVEAYGREPARRSGWMVPGDQARPTRATPVARSAGARRLIRRLRRRFEEPRRDRRYAASIESRLGRMAVTPPTLLAIVRPHSFHTTRRGSVDRHVDPVVEPVLRRLSEAEPVAVVAESVTLRHERERRYVESDERVIPSSYLLDRLAAAQSTATADVDLEDVLRGLPSVPLLVGERDLGPALRATIDAAKLGHWLAWQRRMSLAAEELIGRLRPRVVLTGWESARTAWLAAASRQGVPTIAIQHGVIYPGNPDYYRPEHPGRLRPSLTCVFGPYERDRLIEAGYGPTEVRVCGSPRVEPDAWGPPMSMPQRSAVRRGLGVADTDRMLVISMARGRLGDAIHSVAAMGRVLDGPLPGIHLVFKAHPEERLVQRYPLLVEGLARAGGYRPPAMSVVRDVDVFILLRAADAHLGLYSTLLTDAVLAGAPNMIVVGQAWQDLLGYVAAGVATPVANASDVRAFMADPKPPAASDRTRFVEAHFAAGDASERIVEAIRAQLATTSGRSDRDGHG